MTFTQVVGVANLAMILFAMFTAIRVTRCIPGFWSLSEAEEPEPQVAEPKPAPFRPPKPGPYLLAIAFPPRARDGVVRVLIDHGAHYKELLDTFIVFRPQEGDGDLESWGARYEPVAGVYIVASHRVSVPNNSPSTLLGFPIYDPS